MELSVEDLVRHHGTPLFVAHEEKVAQELARLRDAFRAVYPRTTMAYSVKTNYLPTFVRRAHVDGHLIEVVSRHEWEYVRRLGVPDDRIMLNGPVKSNDDIREALTSGTAVNVDSRDELERVAGLGRGARSEVPIGLRVSAPLPTGHRSRFGLSVDDAVELGRKYSDAGLVRVVGLHIHYSMDRSAASYAQRVELLSQVAIALKIFPDYLDIGGGQASVLPPSVRAQLGYDVSTFEEYAAEAGGAMLSLWGPDGPKLILEPGTATLAGSMSYACQVVSTRAEDGVIVVDGTMFDINPLRSRVHPPIHLARSDGRTPPPAQSLAQVYGATCMEIDVLGQAPSDARPGDIVVVENVGAYGMVLSPDFILPHAAVVDGATGEIVRPAQSLGSLGGFA